MPSEISQTERDRYCRISLICGILKNQTHRKRDQIGGCQGWGVEEGELDEGGQKAQTSSYKINHGNVMYRMMILVNNNVLQI